MPKAWKFAAFVSFLGCAHADVAPATDESRGLAHYEVTIFDNLGAARVHACFHGFTVRALVPIDGSAARGVRRAWSGKDPLEITGGRIDLPNPSRKTCLTYEASFRNVMFRTKDSTSVIVSQAEWLWRPDPFPRELDTAVRFELPPNAEVSVAWPRTGATYFPDKATFFVSGYSVLGAFAPERFAVGATEIDVARLEPRLSSDLVRSWLTRAVEVVGSVGGRFPQERLHFVLVPVQDLDRPVAFGMVRRGGGASVLLVPSSAATASELEADWVAIHELSHLWLPRLYREDRWLTEGVATYLQEVLRARCGLQSGARAWERIHDGFERGHRAGTGRLLASESRDMNRTGAYHRVYWAGTAFALEADVRLRESSGGEMTLLRALDLAQHRWSQHESIVEATEMLATLDELSGTDFLEELGKRYAANADFPSTSYIDSPEYAEVRASIMKRDDEACTVNAESSR